VRADRYRRTRIDDGETPYGLAEQAALTVIVE